VLLKLDLRVVSEAIEVFDASSRVTAQQTVITGFEAVAGLP